MKRSSLMTFSVVAHVAVAIGLGAIQVQKSKTPAVVELIDAKKPKAEPEPPPPPEPPKAAPQPKQSRPRAAARADAPPPSNAQPRRGGFDGVPDFGLALSGTGEGLAIAVGQPEPPPASPPPPKSLVAPPPAPKRAPACTASIRKPVPVSVPKPEYPVGVRDFTGDGKVRVKLTVDERGRVVNAEILSGLRDEFNQAALAAAKRARFEPGTQCGNPITASFTIAMRFSSG